MDAIYLTTPRVRLRQLRTDDFEHLLALDSDPEVMRHLTDGQPSSPEDIAAVIGRVLTYQRRWDGRLGVYVAERRDTGAFIGWFHLRPDKADLDDTRVLELGYRLTRASWGHGLATEVSRALVRRAFDELDADTVFAQTLSVNLASRRVMEKVGLTFERAFVDDSRGRAREVVIYSARR